ncbi:hypothetical protein HYC85_009252 [Camellia sinensis]|uniref:Nuclear pore complex protein n=1 Tax=Camellia sinensis TaxID=4442 RepID=A0A7J7HH44_CAMSI|nr:hypothetical protein HYC85_009252 [Camellia sinensis]
MEEGRLRWYDYEAESHIAWMNLMMGDIPHLLDVMWSWISPSEDGENVFRPHGDPQMIRFGAHLVLVLRYLLVEQMKGAFKEKIMTVGDLILHMYAIFLFSKHHEELVGIYASQLAHHRCIDLFVHMMELRLNSSVHVKYKIFVSAIEYLPFSPRDDSKGSFEEIVESNILFREFALISMWRVPAMPIGAHTLLSFLAEPLKQPTETLLSTEDHDVSENLREFQDWSEYYSCDTTYRNWLKVELENVEVSPLELSVEEKQRAIAAAKETLNSSFSLLLRKENPWLVPTEDRVYESVEPLFLELHAIAMLCLPSGECMCPDATLCATLMSALYSSVSEEVVLNRQRMVSVSISSTDNYCIEVVLRGLATDGDGLGPHELNDGSILATVIAAGFKGELVRFQAGITMEISRLDAWYSSKDGSLEGPATYIVRGLCRRCCIPEVILRCMQSGNPHESHDELIELVALPETGFLHLFSQQQLQVI